MKCAKVCWYVGVLFSCLISLSTGYNETLLNSTSVDPDAIESNATFSDAGLKSESDLNLNEDIISDTDSNLQSSSESFEKDVSLDSVSEHHMKSDIKAESVLHSARGIISDNELNHEVNSEFRKQPDVNLNTDNELNLKSELKSEIDVKTGSEITSETDDLTPGEGELTPEDEDMTIMKLEKLGGLLDSKDLAEITDEEETIEDTEDSAQVRPEDVSREGLDNQEEDELKFEPIPMPTDFESYDQNNDGYIDMQELIKVTGAFENVKDVLHECDTNGDDYIDRQEFDEAPLDLAGKPPEVIVEEYD